MSKSSKPDQAGDSDELQALFDSFATTAPTLTSAADADTDKPVEDESADSDELQALFDAVADAGHGGEEAKQAADDSAEVPSEDDDSSVFRRLGRMTRQLHDVLRQLGLEAGLQEAARSMPDARERLDYIAQMTEQAANRVLNATDVATPLQARLQERSGQLRSRWDEVFAGKLSTDEFRQLSSETQQFMTEVETASSSTSEQLMNIILAQDFQDLTGQVIKRVLETVHGLEQQLLQILLDTAPEMHRAEHKGLLNGPVVGNQTGEAVVTSQAQVDDLLESLGF